ncbi:MAG: nitrilase family protein [Bacteroidaceae bacterium]|nr:nitrilase family protein [Bacteroidaceae bacterium]
MKVALVQMDIVWENSRANREVAERLMLSAEKSDIYVLPEMWNTGVTTEPMGVAEPEDGETLLWMQKMADKLDAAVCGSIAIKTLSSSPLKGECSYRNRLYFVKPQEIVNCKLSNCKWYDKHHLFSYGGETEHYTPGSEYVTVEWRGLRFHLSICYDLRFPIWLRNRDDYEVLICVASWPTVRMHAWKTLLAARAIENQCYVLGVNRIGKDPYCEYSGGTCVVDPFGFSTDCPDGEACVLTKTLDLKRLRSFREKFPVLKEMDSI